jgi:hypothetical protein
MRLAIRDRLVEIAVEPWSAAVEVAKLRRNR